jgi:hypothetical protein
VGGKRGRKKKVKRKKGKKGKRKKRERVHACMPSGKYWKRENLTIFTMCDP